MEEGQNQHKIARKQIKFQESLEKREGDGISALPDCLLLEILSRLPSTKDAIRTGTLSKRWKHLWTWVPTLIFSPSHDLRVLQNPKLMPDFALVVDKTLIQCRQLKLKKFQVRTFYDIRFESLCRDWIRFAVSCNVEELNLDFLKYDCEFALDQFIFTNSYFTDLSLAECKLNPTAAISWENLKSLCISGVHLDEDLLVNILSGSPLLETLVLKSCKWPHIPSESESESESDSDMAEISAPTPTGLSLTQCRQLKQLKKFNLVDYDVPFHPQISNLLCYALRCNVKEVNLGFGDMDCGYEFTRDPILFTGSCFTELTLEGYMLNPVGAISWKSLRSLCLFDYKILDEDLIENILSGSPVLETLELKRCGGYRRLDITSKSVKNLVLCGCIVPFGESKDDVIEIKAPNILSLRIERGPFLCKLLLNVSSLVKAYFNYTFRRLDHRKETPKEEEQEMLKGFIMNLGHVKELELGVLCAEVLSCLQAKGFVSPHQM